MDMGLLFCNRQTKMLAHQLHKGSMMRGMQRMLTWALCAIQVFGLGCAMRLARNTDQEKAELLASERGRLLETDSPVAKTKSYIVISGILLDFAEADIREGTVDVLPRRLDQYVEAITAGRDTLIHSDINAQRDPGGYREFEAALRAQIARLDSMVRAIQMEQRPPVAKALESASSIREQILQRMSPAQSSGRSEFHLSPA
jgi:hypothetical protein